MNDHERAYQAWEQGRDIEALQAQRDAAVAALAEARADTERRILSYSSTARALAFEEAARWLEQQRWVHGDSGDLSKLRALAKLPPTLRAVERVDLDLARDRIDRAIAWAGGTACDSRTPDQPHGDGSCRPCTGMVQLRAALAALEEGAR